MKQFFGKVKKVLARVWEAASQIQVEQVVLVIGAVSLVVMAYASVHPVAVKPSFVLSPQTIVPNYFRQIKVIAGEDAIPLDITGYTTQTNPLFVLRNVAGTQVFSITNAGAFNMGSGSIGWASIDKTGSSLADLTTKSAGALTSGSLSDSRLSANVPLLDGAILTFTGDLRANAITATNLSGSIPASGLTGSIADARLSANVPLLDGAILTFTGDLRANAITATNSIAANTIVTGTLKGATIPMVGSDTRPIDFRSVPTTTSNLNTTLAYFRADLDKDFNESVVGEDGFTVGMFRAYVGATNMQGAIIEGLRAGVNLDAAALVNDPAGAGYIAGARITTYVPATANVKTNKGLIVAPRDDTSEAAISGSQYIGAQIYLKQAIAKDESFGLDIYSENGSANYDAAINLRNGGSEQYGYGIDMNDMSVPAYADIRFSQGETIANLVDGEIELSGNVSVTGVITSSGFIGPMTGTVKGDVTSVAITATSYISTASLKINSIVQTGAVVMISGTVANSGTITLVGFSVAPTYVGGCTAWASPAFTYTIYISGTPTATKIPIGIYDPVANAPGNGSFVVNCFVVP